MPAPVRSSHTRSPRRRPLTLGVATAVVALLSTLVAGPAADAAPTANPGKSALSGRTFISETVSGSNPLPGGGPITMTFGTTNSVGINAGCNQMRSTVNLARGRFTVKQPMASTMRLCPGPAMGADGWVSWFLKQRPVWRLSGADLVLTTPSTRVRLVDRKEAADRPFIGTTWKVTGLVRPGARVNVSSLTKDAPTLRFADYQVTGSTGCNYFSASAIPVLSLLIFSGMSTATQPCSNLGERRVEKAVLATLADLRNFQVDGRNLTIVDSSGSGLIARTDR